MKISYENYLDRVHGGWLGKCIGGTIGARFEGKRDWLEIAEEDLFPDEIPPNDDLDLQILWLKVLEEKGADFTSEDLAEAWLEGCWYPFNEYGVFRRNWRLGIAPPLSGAYGNPFWETGMGCPIRSEIWGYICPGSPALAAEFAQRDGCLDHTEQSIGAEQMWSAMAAMAFFESDVRNLIDRCIHYLPAGTPIARLSRMAIDGFDSGRSHRDVRDQILANAPCGEACDAQINVPFTILGLLYGEGDLTKTLIYSLNCGYDTDCTLATAGALVGQLLGAKQIPGHLLEPIGDELVMGIQYRREEMTVSALARDTARIGILFGLQGRGTAAITDAPDVQPFPPCEKPAWNLRCEYDTVPCAAPGDTVKVRLRAEGQLAEAISLQVAAPDGWSCMPSSAVISPLQPELELCLHLSRDVETVPQRNIFEVTGGPDVFTFGVKGADCWKLLGVFFDSTPPEGAPRAASHRSWANYFIDPRKEYLSLDADGVESFRSWSATIGRPAILPVRELMLEPERQIPLQTAWCAYVEREVICPEDRDVTLFVGHNVATMVWVNGEEVLNDPGDTHWQPRASWVNTKMTKGRNVIRVKLVRVGGDVEFSLSVQDKTELPEGQLFNHCEYSVMIEDVNPLIYLREA